MIEYTSDVPVYVDGLFVEAGTPFSTSRPKGSTWTEVNESDIKPVAPAEKPKPPEPEPRPDQDKRDVEIFETLSLLDEHDWVRTGPRAGRPKCSAIENIVGYPVFIDEVDPAWDRFLAPKPDEPEAE